MKIVLDTNVVVAAMRSTQGGSSELLRQARKGRIQLLANVALALEYEAICLMPEHVLAAQLSRAQADIFVTAVIAMCDPVETHFLWRPQLRDPADEFVLEAAVNGGASAVITFNQRDFLPAAGRFGLDVMKPVDLIRRLAL
ncbi:putative toxin-antitoxin system toxin component, PIN family [Asticcacaulis sp. YBE204]|uniref:putative toxin-antitoxin system toxin component, PIN family n=1 Tax=Asticcacaulis sp. YBE204 TaxID=1282363 RepID=UPI0003C3D6E4|nr:putative toxin-antitoxin system toxin component, PIN family [Asticcacaulis sp. YBE204]ESQ80999.1 hypothetical protein AEYBE204_01355 [Asticcacaulis sp. YBE204]